MRATRFCAIVGLAALLGLGGCDRMTELALTGGGLFDTAEAVENCPAATGEEGRSCRTEEQGQALDSASSRTSPGTSTRASSAPIVEAPLYCYRTLAAITCYASPDPYASPSRRVQ